MSSYTDRFGTGAMPTFNIGQGQGNTSWKYGGDESAAIMEDHLAERAADYADQKAFFQDTTMPALKAMFNPDEPEKDPMDAYLDEEAAAIAAAEEEQEGIALDRHAAAVEAMTDDHAYRESWRDGHLGGADETGAVAGGGKQAAGLAALALGTGSKAIPALGALIFGGSALHDKYTKIDPHLREKIKEADPEAFTSHEREDATWKDKFSDYWMNLGGFQYNLADGGRVGMNTGGLLPWTQTMDSDYANQYYNQFNDPVYTATQGATTPTNPTTPDPTLGFAAPMTPAVPLSGGLAQQRGRGPEDRGTFAERFGTAEDQGYGYSGTPGEGGSATFNDPAYGSSVLGTGTGDTYTPASGIGYADDEYGRERYIGIADDLGLNLYNAAYPVADALTDPSNPIPGIWGWLANKVTGGTKKDEEEEEAVNLANQQISDLRDERRNYEKAEEDRLAKEAEQSRQKLAELAAAAAAAQGNDPKPPSVSSSPSPAPGGSGNGNYGHHGFGGPSGHGSGMQGGQHGANKFSRDSTGRKNW
jgi:hypothetical protein